MTRPPIIAVLGHVDHGKTTLLDSLRKSPVVAAEPGPPRLTEGEAGGITQTIGAFKIPLRPPTSLPAEKRATSRERIVHEVGEWQAEAGDLRHLTFIDTPGHEAFSKMRSRGAVVADIALLVVAADDGVKPQTLESLSIIKSAGIPFIVCINKIDLDNANPQNVKTELAKHDCPVEGFGGTVPVVEISAKEGKNLPELLEMINLVWEMHLSNLSDLRNLSNLSQLEAPIIDSRLDPRSGPIASVVIRQGIIRLGDKIAAGQSAGKVKSLADDRGRSISQAFPGDPVQVLGLKSVPPVGSVLTNTGNQQSVISNQQQSVADKRSPITNYQLPITNVILKADSVATLQTMEDSVASLPESKFSLVASGIGDVTESDILLAGSSKSNIIGFRIKVSKKRQDLAKNEGVLIITDFIIYRLLEKLTDLQKPPAEKLPAETGRAKIVKLFTVDGVEIAGCVVESGKLTVGDPVFLVKDNLRLGPFRIKQLKFRSENIKDAKIATECGVLLSPESGAQKLKLSEGQDIIAFQETMKN